MARKMTAPRVTVNNDKYGTWSIHEKITCEVTGEMADRSKVWTDQKTGKQYFLLRMLGHYYFHHI